MQPLPVDQLIFKGTHNSYSCTGEDTPAMLHSTDTQIDDFALWALELDYGVKVKNGIPVPLVGHDDEGHATCFMTGGFELVRLLRTIRNARALQYRPVFIFFDIKDWDEEFDRAFKLQLGIAAVNEAFDGNFIELKRVVEDSGRFPTVPELAGKAVLYFPNETLRTSHADHCTSRESVENAIATGILFEEGPLGLPSPQEPCGSEGCRVLRIDQYQADWTFDYGVPPNPIVVDGTAQPPSVVRDARGDEWECRNGDVSHGEAVGEQGTFRFPYKTVGRGITRAEGTTPNGVRDLKRAGFGWTVLIRPGNYAESLRIDIPLTLKKDDRFDGSVVITGQPARMIRSLWMTFHTNDENKDADTGLLVQVKSTDGRVLARFQQIRDDAQAGLDLDEDRRHFEKVLTL